MSLTENQAKAADLLSMMNENGMGTMAHELQEMLEEAWSEGKDFGEDQEFGYRTPANPYMKLPIRPPASRN